MDKLRLVFVIPISLLLDGHYTSSSAVVAVVSSRIHTSFPTPFLIIILYFIYEYVRSAPYPTARRHYYYSIKIEINAWVHSII